MFPNVYAFKIRLICVQNVMYVMLATIYQFNLRYLLRFINISSAHGAFPPSINVHVQDIGTQRFCQGSFKKVLILES